MELKTLVHDKALSFSRYSIQDRAIPMARDGLKRVQRRLIYSLYKEGTRYNKYRVKVMDSASSAMKYSPHGDTSIVDATKRLGSDAVNYKLIDGQGAYGHITSTEDNGGAARYIEARLSYVAEALLVGLDKEAVDFSLTYDEKRTEPDYLVSLVPFILMNSQSGIATGIASKIPSFDLKDIRENIDRILKRQPTIPMFPTFETGGFVFRDNEVAENVSKNGRGGYRMRARYRVEGNDIIVTELPYGSKVEKIIEKILSLYNNNDKNVQNITEVNDDTDRDGFKLRISTKKNTDIEKLMLYLYKKTELESVFHCNMYVLDNNNNPKLMGYDEILLEWIKARSESIVRITKYDLNHKNNKLNLLYGLRYAVDHLDDIINIIRQSNTDEEAITNLIKKHNMNKEQSEHIVDMKLRSLNKNSINSRIKQISTLEKEIADLEKILKSKKLIAKIIMDDVDKFIADNYIERKTEIVDNFDEFSESEDKNNVFNDYNVKVFVTNDGYVKCIPLTSLRSGADIKVKEDDFVKTITETVKSEEMLIFTNTQNVYKKRLLDIDDNKPSDYGTYLINELSMGKDEEIVEIVPLSSNTKYVLIGYDNGKVAKIYVDSYRTTTNRTKLANASGKENILFVRAIDEDIDFLSVSSNDKAVLFNSSNINAKSSKSSNGVVVQKLKDGHVVSYYKLDELNDFEDYRSNNPVQGKKI